MYIVKRDNVRTIRIVLDLLDVIVDSKKIVLFEYEQPLLLRAKRGVRNPNLNVAFTNACAAII